MMNMMSFSKNISSLRFQNYMGKERGFPHPIEFENTPQRFKEQDFEDIMDHKYKELI